MSRGPNKARPALARRSHFLIMDKLLLTDPHSSTSSAMPVRQHRSRQPAATVRVVPKSRADSRGGAEPPFGIRTWWLNSLSPLLSLSPVERRKKSRRHSHLVVDRVRDDTSRHLIFRHALSPPPLSLDHFTQSASLPIRRQPRPSATASDSWTPDPLSRPPPASESHLQETQQPFATSLLHSTRSTGSSHITSSVRSTHVCTSFRLT